MDGSSYGQLALPKPEGVSNNEIKKAEEATRAEWIRALDEAKGIFERLKKISETMSPVDADSSETEEAMKVRQPSRVQDEPPEQALDATIRDCSCRIDSEAVKEEWARAMKSGDCVTLLRALKKTPCLLDIGPPQPDFDRPLDRNTNLNRTVTRPNYQLSDTPITVLQWAAKQRCLELLVHILCLFLDGDGKVVGEYKHGAKIVDRKVYFEKQNETGLTAEDFQWSVRNSRIYHCFAHFTKHSSTFNRTLREMLPEMQLELLEPNYVPPSSASSVTSAGILDENVRMREIVLKATKKHKSLLDVITRRYTCSGYNFVKENDVLLFHFACERLAFNANCKNFVKEVIREVAKEGPKAVEYLFNYRSAQGLAPLHGAYIYLPSLEMFDDVLEMLKEELGTGEEYGDCWNSRDVAGWTVLHLAASRGHEHVVKALLQVDRVDVNAEVKTDLRVGPNVHAINRGDGATALHLAIIYDRLEVARFLIAHGADVNKVLKGSFEYEGIAEFKLQCLTPLYLAIVVGRANIVKALIDHPQVQDGVSKDEVSKDGVSKDGVSKDGDEILAIHIVAIMGDPKIIRYLTNNSKFNISVPYNGCTALHFVVYGGHLSKNLYVESLKKYCHDAGDFEVFQNDSSIDKDREACISMLIQGGLDVWQKNENHHFPEPGPDASSDVRYFWYQKVLTETQDAKNNLNVAGNAISVVSALVATASYVGPLQPPLGLDSNSIQDGSLPIRVYMVTNTLSFYMAITSIIFAVVPSLPMPQEGLYDELQRSQKSIIYAIHLLLLAVITILISFGAASNVVVSSEYSWKHQGIVFYPTLLGGLISTIAISLFCLRLLRLTFVKNMLIKQIYQYVFRANRK